MIVISDASPLHYLILIGQEQLLLQMFGRVIVPTAVLRELQRDAAPQAVKASVGYSPKWLEAREPATDPGPSPSNLGEGEWHALVGSCL